MERGRKDMDAERALEEARREAAGRTIEDQGTEGGLTEVTHGVGEENPLRRRHGDDERGGRDDRA